MRVFLVSPYHSGSHRSWAEGYAASSEHEVHLVSMPGSFWQWRLAGSYVTLAERTADLAERVGDPEVILATSLVDVAGLKGLLTGRMGPVAVALYMHENQVTYPAISRSRTERHYGLINWTSQVAAEAIAFNSEFHRRAWFEALPGFLNEFPDERHHSAIPAVEAKSIVLPVGCEVGSIVAEPKSDPPLLVWNHRWDPDKDPGTFLRIVTWLAEAGAEFELALLGERFVNQRPEFDSTIDALGDRVVVDEHLERPDYLSVIARSSLVVSTAVQEFFGLSVVEGIAAGCFPILPRRLVYPERVPEDLVARCLYGSEDEAVVLIGTALEDMAATRRDAAGLRDTVEVFDWSVVAPAYDAWLESTTAS